ncbi:MAG TPA: tellurite resistance methyltransferase TehB, partial [Burkholderiaceae bacterium]|nr:tellurite resistance methyltransferase TehB [Burkholderiaceae bacterium]
MTASLKQVFVSNESFRDILGRVCKVVPYQSCLFILSLESSMATDINSQYGLNPAHSEVVEACGRIAPCAVLDMGSSSGRNALYMSQLGFDVTAVDKNPAAINTLQQIVGAEQIGNINAQVYDISHADIGRDYGFIVCTVTLMFLDPARIDAVLSDMQERTLPGGYNLIVCAMNTDEHPCPLPFPFTFATGQLSTIYKGWELIKYNEDLGTMHNGARL